MPAAPEDAAPGAIFVVADQGGWAVPPRKFSLQFGHDEDEVHVPLGVDDPYVSRQQGALVRRMPGTCARTTSSRGDMPSTRLPS